MSRSWAGALAVIVILAVVLGVAALRYKSVLLYGPGPLTAETTVIVSRGTTTEAIGRQLEAAGAVKRGQLFQLAAQLLDKGASLKAGEYAFAPAQSLHDIIQQLRDGRTVVHHLTVPEGLTVVEIVAIIQAESALSGEVGAAPPEGSLMPDTYNFSRLDSRGEMITRMRRAMDKALAEIWQGRVQGLPISDPAAALVLASIVDKETGNPDERAKVASVFVNRLSRGMRLQSDPTVIYAVTQGKGPLGRPLSHADLALDSPFNSYLRTGLPPTPIACPGRDALRAVAHPETSPFLYFVADGTGRHAFAETLDEHNRNVTRLRQIEKGNDN